jgi:hypothetical protein
MKTWLLKSKVEKDRIYYMFWVGRLGGVAGSVVKYVI